MKKNTISNFFDVLSNEVMSFFISKKTVSKLNFLKFKERRAIDFISDYWSYFWRQWFAMPLILVAILVTGYTTNAQSIKGVVPVQYPLLGDGIDGDGWAHEPTGTSSIYLNVGDLFDRKNYLSGKPIPGTNPQEYYPIDGTNHGILNLADGSLLYPGTIDPVPVTFFLKDPFQNDPTIFTSSNKINDNPNTYTWGPGSSPNKNEIQNCGAHFSYGKDGMDGGISTNGTSFSFPITGNSKDLWCLFAGDRQVTNGSSYIDFEFLQKRLTITGALPNPGVIDPLINTAPITGGSGSFISEGTDGGRTLGDLLITIEFTQGGGDATVVIQKWSEKAGGGFEYVVVFDGVNYSVPGIKGNIFCTNNTSTTDVPFDVYGSGATGSYAPNQWAEGGINLTQVFKATSSECFTISTLFIRTRSSGNSSQSELKDFPGRPIQLDLDFTPKAFAGADFTKTCISNPDGKEIGETPQAGFTYSWSPAEGLSVTNIANPIANPLVNTTYTVTKTKTGTSCSDTDEVIVTVNKPTVVAVAGDDFTKNCLINTSGGSIGEAAAAGYTYSWVSSPVGFTSTSANPMVNPSVTTTYTVTKTHTTSGCTATDDVTVTVNNTLPNANAGADAQILCGNTTVGLSGSSTTIGATFLWTASNGGHIVSGADTASPIVDADGTYTLTVTDPANGCTATDDALVTTQICVKAICTYTQGYYGNVGGKSCAEGISYSTKELIAKALTSYGGKMTIGTLGHSVYIMNNMTDINALISVMPGGGGSYVLSAGNYEINSLPSSYLKNGRINNTLLAQTIALGLNIGINSNLGNFTLQAGTLAVAVPQGGCGSEIAKERTCNLDGTVNNEYKYYTIPSNVVTALGGNPTVQGLFDLANQALGGGSTNGLSLSAIAGLEDLLNNAFDECRIFVGYNVAPLNCPVLSLTSKVTQTEIAGFTASPVPFKDQLTIKYGFDYQSDVKIEVFNTQGNLVYSKRDTNSFLNKNVVLDLNINKGQEQVFIVKLTTDRGSSSKKVMSSQ